MTLFGSRRAGIRLPCPIADPGACDVRACLRSLSFPVPRLGGPQAASHVGTLTDPAFLPCSLGVGSLGLADEHGEVHHF
jgi:hypothetical protein